MPPPQAKTCFVGFSAAIFLSIASSCSLNLSQPERRTISGTVRPDSFSSCISKSMKGHPRVSATQPPVVVLPAPLMPTRKIDFCTSASEAISWKSMYEFYNTKSFNLQWDCIGKHGAKTHLNAGGKPSLAAPSRFPPFVPGIIDGLYPTNQAMSSLHILFP